MPDATKKKGDVRLIIRDAMERLLEGRPIRSDGKLTIKSLAAEAGVKRWVLTHQHTDLQQEFRDRCAGQGDTPANQTELVKTINELNVKVASYKERVADLSEENNRLARIIQVLTLETLQLYEKLDDTTQQIHHLR
jgi:predicted nuclease with TOPRIM domain